MDLKEKAQSILVFLIYHHEICTNMLSNPPKMHKGNENLPNENLSFTELQNTHIDLCAKFPITYQLRT